MLTSPSERSSLPRCTRPFAILAAAAGLTAPAPLFGQLMLTPDGLARGFQLRTFATDFSVSNGIGPEGIGFEPDGTVLVTTFGSGNLQRFQNTNNQSAATTPVLASYGTDGANDVRYLGNTAYMSQYAHGDVVQLNHDGSINHVVVSGLASPLGLAPDFATGRIFVGMANGIVNLDPVSGMFSTLVTGSEVDGLTLAPDGSVLYAAVRGGTNSQHLIGYDTTSGSIVFDSGLLNGGVDGTALGFGPLLGNIYANMNNGTLIEINLHTMAQTLIASGGSRGDFVAADPTGSGDVLITQGDRIMRLVGVPAPSSMLVIGGGFLAWMRRRR